MRLILLYFILFSSLISAQLHNKNVVKIDSVEYYVQLSNFNVKTNNYKLSLDFAQKTIDYSKKIKNIKAEAQGYSLLGSLYFDIKKYDDAIKAYYKSIILHNTLPQSNEQAYAYYKLGLCFMEKNGYSRAESYFEKSRVIYLSIKIPNAIELINLQKAIAYEAKGKYNLALPIFNQIIAKTDSQDIFKTKAEALYRVGNFELQNNRKNLALNYLIRAYDLNAIDKNAEQKAKILLSLSIVYEKLLNTEKAHQYFKEHIHLKDSIAVVNSKKLGSEDYAEFKKSESMKTIEEMDRKKEQTTRKIK